MGESSTGSPVHPAEPSSRDEATSGDDAAAAETDEPRSGYPEPAGPTDGVSPPWRRSTKLVAGVAAGVAAVGAIYLARNALTLVAMAGLLAFLVAPLIRVLQRRARFPKILAVLTSYAVAVALLAVLTGAIVVGVASSFAEVDPAEAADAMRQTAIDGLTAVRTVGIGQYTVDLTDVVDPTIARLEQMPEDDDGTPRPSTTLVVSEDQVDLVLGGLVSSAQVVGGLLAAIVVTFVVALYLSADSHRLHAGLLAQVPPAYRRDAERVDARIGRVWRGYLYGQLLNSLATGLLVWLVLWAVGLPGAFVLGLIMMVLNMIPTFGPIIAAIPGVLAAIALGSTRLDWGTLSFTLLVIAIYIVVVQLQANLMAPFITGQAVQMSPAAVLIGLIVGFQVGGLVGSLLAVPVIGTLKEVARYVLAKLLDRDPFPEDGKPSRRRSQRSPAEA
jgi:predicted PurR-regulated permease PerM